MKPPAARPSPPTYYAPVPPPPTRRARERHSARVHKKHDTPAKRARLRRDPAIAQPPPKVVGTRTSSIRNLMLRSRGRTYPIGANVEGDTPWSLGMDQAGTFTLPLRDPAGDIVEILGDESNLQQDGVTVTVDKVIYVVVGFDHDGEGKYTLTLEDQVAWRLKQFSKFRSASRARTTRYAFIQGFVDEASRKPLTRMRSFIPEIDDKQTIRRPKKT
jgi:hypothetical protein